MYAGQRFTLTQGFAEITTQRGAVATIEAPATIELIDNDNAIHLEVGKLVGICKTESSRGFVVRTGTAEITDIGTAFAVEVRQANGPTSLQVFDGYVEAASRKKGTTRGRSIPVFAYQAAVITSESIKAAEFESSQQFDKLSIQLTGDFDVARIDQLSVMPGMIESDDVMYLIHERKSAVLEDDVRVAMPVDRPIQESPVYRLPAGTLVDSYTIHYDLVGRGVPGSPIFVEGEIRFDRPILGVIVEQEDYDLATALVGNPAITYYPQGIRYLGMEPEDIVSVSEDRRTLKLNLGIVAGMDRLRVLVAGKDRGN